LKKFLTDLDEYQKENYEEALTKCFMNMDEKVSHEQYSQDMGTTICVVLITDTKIYCANSGDSRGVLCNSATAHPLSFDHKPYNELEKMRIQAANHYVEMDRVDGSLALSRAIGDFNFKDQT